MIEAPIRTDLTPGRVSLDELGPYEVLLAPQRWNGAGIPYFTRAEADRFVADITAAGWMKVARYDAMADAYIFQEPDDEEPQTFERLAGGLYCIGGWSWTWWAEEPVEVKPEPVELGRGNMTGIGELLAPFRKGPHRSSRGRCW